MALNLSVGKCNGTRPFNGPDTIEIFCDRLYMTYILLQSGIFQNDTIYLTLTS